MATEWKLLPKPATVEMQQAAGARGIAAYDAMWDAAPRVLTGKFVSDTAADSRPVAGDTDWMCRALKAEALLAIREAPQTATHRVPADGEAGCSVEG